VDVWFGNGYLARSDTEFQKLATLGLTIIIACGDTGAADLGPAPGEDTCTPLHPDWPSQSPYVTALGSTFFTPYSEPICYLPANKGGVNCANNVLGEVTTSMDIGLFWTTGGGFSNVQARPPYQDPFISIYFTNYSSSLPPANIWNNTGRAYPDLVTIGHNVIVAVNDTFIAVDGTSASAPIFAGMVTLWNNRRFNLNKEALGFLNIILYKIAATYPAAFNDIIVGRNRCGAMDTTPVCCPYGYQAVPGFDAVSGLGSPNYAVIAAIIETLQ